MRTLVGWFSVVLFSCGCNGNDLPLTPTPTPAVPVAPTSALPNRDAGNWTPWSFAPWQPGLGAPLELNATVNATVDEGDICVPDIYQQWGARSCQRFVVRVTSVGWFHGFVRWDASATGFDQSLAGEVVLVAPTGRFATSDWKHIDTEVVAKVDSGAYDVLAMSYVPATLPFQIRGELRPE